MTRTILLFLTAFLLLEQQSSGQTNAVKEIFFDLPLDKSKNEITVMVTSDTIKFKTYSKTSEELFRSTPRNKNKFLPESNSEPILSLIDNELKLTLNYSSAIFKKRKAAKAYEFLANKLSGSFSSFTNSEPEPGFDYSLLKERKFYLAGKTEAKCIIKLEKHLGTLKVTISYFL